MKQIIYLGEVYLVIYNNSNNWLLTKSKKVAMEHNEEDLQKCSSFCFQPSTITLHITVFDKGIIINHNKNRANLH